MTTAIDVDTIAKPEPKRDQWDRYLITPPPKMLKGGVPSKAAIKPKAYTRTSTVAKTLDETYLLERWAQRQVAYGIGLRPDLQALVIGHNPVDHRKTFENVIDEASSAAAAKGAANLGTALHKFTEDLDTGLTTLDTSPKEWQQHLHVYRQRLAEAAIEIHPEHVETIVANDDYKVAGILDRAVTLTRNITVTFPKRTVEIPAGTMIIGDLKTGANLDYSWLNFGIQVSIYANHQITWTVDLSHPQGGTRGERIPVSTDVALVIHLPATLPKDQKPTCDFYWLDLQQGWDAALCAFEVREHRTAKKNIVAQYQVGQRAEPTVDIEEATAIWVRQRVSALAGNVSAINDLRNRWPDSIVGKYPDQPSAEQTNDLAKALDLVEAKHSIPFGPPRPGGTPETIKRRKAKA